MKKRPHPLNVIGDFYVEDGCCIICGVPTTMAPAMFRWDSEHDAQSCYVSRQPRSDADRALMVDVMRSQEVPCIRYRGTDRSLASRIADAVGTDSLDDADLPGK